MKVPFLTIHDFQMKMEGFSSFQALLGPLVKGGGTILAALSTHNGANHIHARVTRNPLLAKSGPPFVEIFENKFRNA